MLRKTKADIGKSPHQLFVLVCVSEIVAAVYQIIICYFTAHEYFVNARNTSRLAFDGSGEVARNSTNMALCRFQNGKQYNCDLNASYNIGARYFIREYLKPIPETEWSLIMAKVPELERRTNCTLSTLFSLYAVLNCQTVSVSESWPHGGNESGA